ncbi:MAG: cytochrome c-type biogenesis protein CcmH [SAR86 cluster bacterium]|uniref:Cytochrome c-type biogenesis protein n=1 Tax=SAR86 cluster bacterium TaxID=2030880 RepID=A0A520MYF4_9GAMM|nr:MAG: cytochrome c-type biogenesis protein CcmH [Gammaproteobacteria bacterium TMED193]RZO26244.1 MAG: cytochrome c-type biogenesis protein CcmH [SAR86 cluster bacterium]|tara:strand:- start:24 stop:410 length:387 start_codon:yes stop_codon:yes gene_type:complete
MMSLKIFFSLSILISCLISSEQLYENLSSNQIERLNYLSDNIRCPKCSYGNISSSNAPISKDLKNEIALLIEQGFTNEEIFQKMQDRYGSYILLNSIEDEKIPIYLIPLIALIISIFAVTTYTIKKSK